MTRIPHPIPYQGSKRLLAPTILKYFPEDAKRLIEPFAGAAAVSIAAAKKGLVSAIILNDSNRPLMDIWAAILKDPKSLAAAYEKLWTAQLGREREYYDIVRSKFNETHRPEQLLYLLARCAKASVRYNAKGDFNQSPDNRRLGMAPDVLRWHVLAASHLLKGKTTMMSGDYKEALNIAQPRDIVYMDPPYQGVCANRDPRYLNLLAFDSFVTTLRKLNERRISFILSYDGKTGNKAHGKPMPSDLRLLRIEIDAGRSSQATLLGRNSNTVESLYLSPALIDRIGIVEKIHLTIAPKQLNLLAQNAP